MIPEQIIRLVEGRPFEPIALMMANGRELHIMHPEKASIGQAGLVVNALHPNRQIEIVDTALIVSARTIYPANPNEWIR